ncbi:hypothetical protein Ddye_030729 [Dipteronia dyeriana]|uniref:Pentatricopeptide repeat-containing protein n=1 Tax=Dipteronia dyeriana TaxID=168575 RepID=A0AAD9THL8_9ROSI|nr:hypothetical protein Ddye_030729 [Dipteronia dyeriana]
MENGEEKGDNPRRKKTVGGGGGSEMTGEEGLFKCGFFREAIDMFAAMNVKPNCNILVSVISACSGLGSLKFGKAIHGYSLRIFHEDNVILENAVLDFYARCGSLESARHLFVITPRRDVKSIPNYG